MKSPFAWLALLLAVLLAGPVFAQTPPPVPVDAATEVRRISLNGQWKFAADYQDWGDRAEWFSPKLNDGVWDTVKVPHTWSHDPRFSGFIGAGWYRLRFNAPAVAPGEHVRLAFGAVFRRARVWLNGELLGSHEFGYTPFEFDVAGRLKPGESNVIVVCADNRWTRSFGPAPQQQVLAWWDDGGIIRDVDLRLGSPIYVAKQKIEATPDLAAGTAHVRVHAWVRNTTRRAQHVRVRVEIAREEQWLPLPPAFVEADVAAGATAQFEVNLALGRDQVSLWQLDAPVLYHARTTVDGHARDTVRFGLRRFEVRGTDLLLNGQPIRLAGANRHASYPGGGQDDPAEVVVRDLQLMKSAGFVFQRLSHYPVAPVALDWADRHGMLLIAEASQTHAPDLNLEDPDLQRAFQAQHREMLERDWNHPSIVAWSVANEIAADTPPGVRWVKTMRDFTRELDPTRLVVFASNTVAKANLKPEAEGSVHGDFVCLNTYGATPQQNAANIDRAHALYPNKPLVVTEYGLRRSAVEDEGERVDWFRAMLAIVRERPFLSGASIWSFNDYRSRYVGTSANGWREWGLIDPAGEPSGTYHALRREHSGFVVRSATLTGGAVNVRLEPRTDFPIFPAADCELRVNFLDAQIRPLATARVPLRTDATMKIPAPPGTGGFRLEIWRGGFRTASWTSVNLK
ncbi:glycoside hydrolase family 2 protein [Horticoccus sp. 23ND18S-11]|uniref:glycoside hydrolase family 2 protein n=1 Tax=Horticoccus sp. 23ND18S-11 TaxID=3391832 RepID=UPI0039C922CD